MKKSLLHAVNTLCALLRQYAAICILRIRRLALLFAACVVNRKGNCCDGSIVLVFFGGLGDFVIWLAAAKELRSLYKDRRITLCCNDAFKELADACGYFDHIVTDRREPHGCGFLGRWRVRKNFAHLECDTLIQCFYIKDYFAATVKARKKLCIERKTTHIVQQKLISFIYDDFLPFDKIPEHYVLQQAHYLKYLGWNGNARLQELPLLPSSTRINVPYFVVFPGASQMVRCWDIKKYAEIVTAVGQKYNLACCICGSQSEGALAQVLASSCSSTVNLINMCGKTRLADLISLIRNARFIVTNDTSAVHIAVGTQTPSVCIAGIWDWKMQTLPYPNFNGVDFLPVLCCADLPCQRCALMFTEECSDCIRSKGRRLCIEKVNVRQVIESIEQVVARNN